MNRHYPLRASLGVVLLVLLMSCGCIDSADLARISPVPSNEREMDIVLPASSEAHPLIVQTNEFYININADGKTSLDGEVMSLAELEEHLAGLDDGSEVQHTAIIRADERCQLRDVISVINLCNRLRISHSLTTATGIVEEAAPVDQ